MEARDLSKVSYFEKHINISFSSTNYFVIINESLKGKILVPRGQRPRQCDSNMKMTKYQKDGIVVPL